MQRSVNRLSTPVSASAPASSRSMLRPHLSPRKKAFLTSTLLLTSTGLICRVLGFFYRIFLTRQIGADGIGMFQLVTPVLGIAFEIGRAHV